MKTISSLSVAAILGGLALLGGCSREVTVKIGVVAPMSGDLAQYGKDMARGAEVAIDELHAERFRINNKRARFELVIEDDKANAEAGKAAAKRLIDAGVVAVFGHFNSGVSIPAAPIYAAAGIPQLSVSTNPQYTRMNLKTTFRITADDIQQGTALGLLINDGLKAKAPFLIDDKTTFGVGLADEVAKVLASKGKTPPRESIDGKNYNYEELAKKLVTANIDVVFFGGDEAVGLPLLKALRGADSPALFVVGDAMCDASFITKAKGLADNNFYCSIAGVPPSWLAEGIGFTQQYKAKFNTAPGSYASLAYTGIHVFAQAMQEAKSVKPAEFLPVLSQSSFDGKIQGSVEFDKKGDVKDGIVVKYAAEKGKLVEKRGAF